jgi:hypothetical protein
MSRTNLHANHVAWHQKIKRVYLTLPDLYQVDVAGERYAIGEQLTLADGAIAGALFIVLNFAAPLLGLENAVPSELHALHEALKEDPFVSSALNEIETAFAEKIAGG